MRTTVDVHNFLQDKNIKHEVFLLPVPARTASRVAGLVGLEAGQIAKVTVVLADGRPYCSVIPGDCRVSHPKIRKVLGAAKTGLATSADVVRLTDYQVGATPPFAHKTQMDTLIDERIAMLEVIYTGSGDLSSVLKVRSADLVSLTGGLVCDVAG